MLLSFTPIKPEYLVIIASSLIIILSFIFNLISKKTNIPSVLLLMLLGVAIQFIYPQAKESPLLSHALVIVGKVGLILIVLEAALDLKLRKNKIKLITKSFFMALFGLIGSAIAIAFIIQWLFEASFFTSMIYAVPLSILSSAIIIPSVSTCKEHKREFMIYESTFSDILGIILFQFLVSPNTYYSTTHVILSVSSNIFITIIVAIIFSYVSVWGIQKLTSHVKLFLIIAVLLLAYAIGSIFHLSSLIIVLFFGLVLNNTHLFFFGSLKNMIDSTKIEAIFKEFYIITLESAFVLRTFFFVIFGLSISLLSLVDYHVALKSLAIVATIYIVRFIFLKIILYKESITPELFVAPRGLITILLFYTIPSQFLLTGFDEGILLYTILITSLVMSISLIVGKNKSIKEVLDNYDDLHQNIETSLEDGHLKHIKNQPTPTWEKGSENTHHNQPS